MSVETPSSTTSEGDVQTSFEWKTLLETFNDNTNSNKHVDLIQSILRWFERIFIDERLSLVFILGKIF